MSRKPFNQDASSGLPQMQDAFANWESGLELTKVTQRIENGLVYDRKEKFKFRGVVQPLSDKIINVKPENLRAFEWKLIHAETGALNLNNNDLIEIKGKRFKVFGLRDYSDMGYMEYHAVEDFSDKRG